MHQQTLLQQWTSKLGMTRNPFRDTLDTELFFPTGQHEAALVKITLGIADRHALIMLAGASGTGKTLVSQMVLQDLDPDRYTAAFVPVYPGMAKGALLGGIVSELDSATPGRYASQRLEQLQQLALDLHSRNRHLVVIIDEAHFLKADALHILRTLSNLETQSEKLVTVLLIAENSLRRRLRNPSYASLRGRITFTISLDPLSPQEMEQFIKYRLLKCKAPANLIAEDSYSLIHQYTQGVPREINKLLYNTLMDAFAAGGGPITMERVQQAATTLTV